MELVVRQDPYQATIKYVGWVAVRWKNSMQWTKGAVLGAWLSEIWMVGYLGLARNVDSLKTSPQAFFCESGQCTNFHFQHWLENPKELFSEKKNNLQWYVKKHQPANQQNKTAFE